MKLFASPMYIKIYANHFVIKVLDDTEQETTSFPTHSFTSQRLLVGNFSEAEKALSQGIQELLGGGLFKKSPTVVIHPMEKVEGGLCEVELKVFNELALGAGASKVIIHLGAELDKEQALKKLRSNQ